MDRPSVKRRFKPLLESPLGFWLRGGLGSDNRACACSRSRPTERASGPVYFGSFTTTTVAARYEAERRRSNPRLSIGGRDPSPARPEGLRRPPGRKVPGLASHRTRAASRPQPASEGARAHRAILDRSWGCSPLIPAAVRAPGHPVSDKRLESIGPVAPGTTAASENPRTRCRDG